MGAELDLSGKPGPPVEIEQLRSELGAAGVQHVLPLLVAAFMVDAPQRLVAIEHAVAESDARAIGEAAHAYRSAAATMHAVALATVLGSLERVRESGDIDAAVRLLPEVRQRNADALTFLATLPTGNMEAEQLECPALRAERP